MTGLTMIVTRLEMAGETWNYAEATVYWQGKPVGESLWVYESWQDRWNYAGDSMDVWADDDLCAFLDQHDCAFLDQHDPEETENVGAEIGPEDLRALVAGAVERFPYTHEEKSITDHAGALRWLHAGGFRTQRTEPGEYRLYDEDELVGEASLSQGYLVVMIVALVPTDRLPCGTQRHDDKLCLPERSEL